MQVTSANDTNVVLLCSEENCPWECHIDCYHASTGQQPPKVPAGMWYCKECTDEIKCKQLLVPESIVSHSGPATKPKYEVKWWGYADDDTSTETAAKMRTMFKTAEEASHYEEYRKSNFLEEFACIDRILSHQHIATARIKYKVLWRNNGGPRAMITTEPAAKVALLLKLLVCHSSLWCGR